MAFTSCTEDLQNNAPLEIQALAQAKTGKTTALEQKSGGYSGPCHCYIKFYAPDNLPFQQSWFLDDVSTSSSTVDFQGNNFGIEEPSFSSYPSPYFPLSSPTGSFDFELSLSTNTLPSSFSLDATVTCVTGSDGVDISTGAFASSYSLTFSRAAADQIISGTPVIGEFNHYFDCNGGGASGS